MKTRRSNQGFTLVELLAVILIILLVAGMAVRMAVRASDQGKFKIAQAEMQQILVGADAYWRATGKLPTSVSQILPYMKVPTIDPWGSPYDIEYQSANVAGNPSDPHAYWNPGNQIGKHIRIKSNGPNRGTEGAGDSLTTASDLPK
jgi:prepilin-type N-terminal cleavage/methylation domain-containing protein